MKRIDYTDPLSQYYSKKPYKERKYDEQSDQLAFCKWLKHEHEGIRFRSDMQAGKKKSYGLQNIADILDPYSGWPDVTIYHTDGKHCGLMIEMKKLNSGAILKDGSLSMGKHVQAQNEVHVFLRTLGWRVEFAEGCEEAKRIFLEYVK